MWQLTCADWWKPARRTRASGHASPRPKATPTAQFSRICVAVLADAVVVGASSSTGRRLVGSIGVRLVRAGRWPVTVVP